MLRPLDLQPGIYKNGTPYSGRSRWAAGNLVRWHEGAIRTVNGWQRRMDSDGDDLPALVADPADEVIRVIRSWTANNGSRHIIAGSNRSLYYISPTGAVQDITPAGIVGSGKHAGTVRGFGTGRYGAEFYGLPRSGQSLRTDPPKAWRVDFWGEDVIAMFVGEGQLYHWPLGSVSPAVPITASPSIMREVVVTDERIVMVFGSENDPRLISWSDMEDFDNWTPVATNYAGFQRVPGVGMFMAAVKMTGMLVIVSEADVQIGRYVGAPFVYGFTEAGRDCGTSSSYGVVASRNFVMWPGERNFWRFDGGGVQPVPSDVAEHFFDDIDPQQRGKTAGVHNSQFDEIWWLYQSKDSPTDEVNKYVCYNYAGDYWTYGTLNRTAGEDAGATNYVLMVDCTGKVYNHEIEGAALPPTAKPFVETGPLEIGNGDTISYIDMIIPDYEAPSNSLMVTIKAKDTPTSPTRTQGPFPMRNPIKPRIRGREIAFRFEGTGRWKIGSMRAETKEGGGR